MNLIFNREENRFRGAIRLTAYVLVSILVTFGLSLIGITVLQYIAIAVFFALVAWLVARGLDNRPLAELGLKISSRWWVEFGIGVVIALIAQSFIFGSEVQLQWLMIEGYGWDYSGNGIWFEPIGIAFVQMLSVGFYEEIIFRGYALRNLSEAFTLGSLSPAKGALIATVFTSLVFSLAHLANPNAGLVSTVNIFVAGLMLAVPVLLTGRLALSVGIHFSWNFVMGAVYGFPVSGISFHRSLINTQEIGPDLWTGGYFGPEAGIIGLIAMFMVMGMAIGYHRWKEGAMVLHPSFRQSYLENRESE